MSSISDVEFKTKIGHFERILTEKVNAITKKLYGTKLFSHLTENISYLSTDKYKSDEKIDLITKTLKNQGLFRNYNANDSVQFTDVLELDLNTVEPALSGPKRPHDRVSLTEMKSDFQACVPNKVGFKGFGVDPSKVNM